MWEVARPGRQPQIKEVNLTRLGSVILPVIGLALYPAVCLWVGLQGPDIVGDPRFLVAYTVLFGLMLLLWRRWPARWSVHWVLLAAVVGRVAFVPFPAGDDVNRYVWEGMIQNEGYNPFVTAPDSPDLEHLRGELWEGINHKDVTTIYWPFSQLLFRLIARVSPTILAFKLVFIAFDLLTIAVLLALLSRLGLPRRHVFLYALNPLVLTFIAGEGHLEVVPVFWVVTALYFLATNRAMPMYLSLGLGVMAKLTPLMLVPFALRRDTVRRSWVLLIPLLLALPYSTEIGTLWATPAMFATELRHNGLFHSLLGPFLPRGAILGFSALAAASLMAYILLFVPNRMRAWAAATYVFLILSPTVHPWYLLMVTPFVVLFRSPSWLVLHLTAIGMVFYWQPGVAGWWSDRGILMAVEYVPFVAAAAWGVFGGRRRWPASYPEPRSVSVVVPVLNEARRIESCLRSLEEQPHEAEVIVVDGGSRDDTVALARRFPNAKVVTSSPGRGVQVREGVEQARGDVVLVLHADSLLAPGTLARALQALRDNPEAVGGAFGATYDTPALRYRFVEMLNNLRASITGISFGDQAQFFRREAVAGLIPPYRLMEDIELSLIMKERGAVVFLRRGVTSSSRRWERSRYAGNFVKVIRLSLSFMIRRRLGLLSRDCGEYYRAYYGGNPCAER
jgi:hypothetical protein